MRKKSFVFILIFPVLFFISCQDLPVSNDFDNQTQTAMIFWTGDIAVDGCGWIIKIGDKEYHPDSLPAAFQIDSFIVDILYDIDTLRFVCGLGGVDLPVLKIKSISKHSEFCAPITINAAPYTSYPNDDVTVQSIFIKDNCLKLKIQYSGGCKNHIFRLVCNIPKCGTPPQPPMTLTLSHDANNDACEALITKDISFDLTPLRNQDSSSVWIIFNAPGFNRKLKYKY